MEGMMTEAEWWACQQPELMLYFLRDSGKASDRKLRLFAVACCRHLLRRVAVDPRDIRAVDAAERYADGESTPAELDAVSTYIWGPPSAPRTAAFACRDAASREAATVMADATAGNAAWAAGEHAASLLGVSMDDPAVATARTAEEAIQAALLRDILGPWPFRPKPAIPAAVLAWNDGCIVKLAASIYEERDFSQERMGVLADALEEAGATDEDILGHCRQHGAVHVRGCWLLDLLLARG
jgi:hypothetical protein